MVFYVKTLKHNCTHPHWQKGSVESLLHYKVFILKILRTGRNGSVLGRQGVTESGGGKFGSKTVLWACPTKKNVSAPTPSRHWLSLLSVRCNPLQVMALPVTRHFSAVYHVTYLRYLFRVTFSLVTLFVTYSSQDLKYLHQFFHCE